VPVESDGALELFNHPYDDPTAEALADWRLNRRTACLGPAKNKFSIRAMHPFQADLTLVLGKRTVFRGVGRQPNTALALELLLSIGRHRMPIYDGRQHQSAVAPLSDKDQKNLYGNDFSLIRHQQNILNFVG
jgi:hypothetical protein